LQAAVVCSISIGNCAMKVTVSWLDHQPFYSCLIYDSGTFALAGLALNGN